MNLTDTQKAQLQSCGTAQEAMDFLMSVGVELTEEQLEAVTGGLVGSWSLEQLVQSFQSTFESLFPDGFDENTAWSGVPIMPSH